MVRTLNVECLFDSSPEPVVLHLYDLGVVIVNAVFGLLKVFGDRCGLGAMFVHPAMESTTCFTYIDSISIHTIDLICETRLIFVRCGILWGH